MKLKIRRKKRQIDRSRDKTGEYQQGKAYLDHLTSLDNTLKEPDEFLGFFSYPQEFKGKTDHGKRSFLVFYFDDIEDYKIVLQYLGDATKRFVNHPQTDTPKLVQMVKEAIENANKK